MKPKTLPKTERRAHPRVQLFAQVQVSRASAVVHVMQARDISKGGLFVEGHPDDYPDLADGMRVELLIFAGDHVGEDVQCNGKIIRTEPGEPPSRPAGFGIVFTNVGDKAGKALAELVTKSRRENAGPSSEA